MISVTQAVKYFVFIVLFAPQLALAFGKKGHQIVAMIAQDNLTIAAQRQVFALTKGQSLAQISTWADSVRNTKKWRGTAPWHYVSIADDQTWQTRKRNKKGDILQALTQLEATLANPNALTHNKAEALAFYVHLLADLHQPLHVGYRHDSGGNKYKVLWFNKPTNLHKVWDTLIIDYPQLSAQQYGKLLRYVPPKQQQQWLTGNYFSWATESKTMRQFAYKLPANNHNKPANISSQYRISNQIRLEQRMQQAGFRLAHKLNLLFPATALNKYSQRNEQSLLNK
ncbi:S1/P1 nuclease [Shewanella intestini]|uniref:S1/P1 nuclease n=1 Tax=Shewanella intestini TaxID=2017544 RepID=A0ABS5I0K7_9GAMM|nr:MULTISPECIES: S1/P1 nuclease [Shewanella]MBR9727557.1 S1/P1 nuclease [Shewanella intestini]MRG35293.1 hypothetical protein [Shewanella sp. XMDDZSB0408]